MLEAMFGDGPEVDIKDLDTETVQDMQAEAQRAKAGVAKKQGKPSVFNKSLVITKLPLVPEYRIDPDFWPELVQASDWCDKKQDKVDKLHYQCHICKHESQNRGSMLTHTRRCMKIFLVCGICNKLYFSISGIAEHAEKHHDNELNPRAKEQTSAMQTK